MAYERINFKARQGVGKNRFIKSQETSTEVYLINEPLLITEPGTPLSPENLNHLDEGIFEAHEAIEVETEARIQGEADTLQAAKEYTDTAQLATQTWKPAVNTFANLPVSGMNNKINYLCRVIADPDTANNGVWQAVAGWTNLPIWTYFSDNADWVDELELAQALSEAVNEHNESPDTHIDIRNEITSESQNRQQADQNLQSQINTLNPQGFFDITYPPGSLFETVDPTKLPGANIPGVVWTEYGRGQTIVGVDDSAEFSPDDTKPYGMREGGAKTHTLTQGQLAAHKHPWNNSTGYGGFKANGSNASAAMNSWSGAISSDSVNRNIFGGSGGVPSSSGFWFNLNDGGFAINDMTDGGGAHNNIQPYKTAYRYVRTA